MLDHPSPVAENVDNDPLVAFVFERIEYFEAESRRLKDEGVLMEYKKLIDTLFLVIRKLGTVDHESAMADLSAEYKRAGPEASQAWSEIWRTFSAQRRRSSALKRQFQLTDTEVKRHTRSIEEFLASSEQEPGVDEVVCSLRAAVVAMKKPHMSRKTFYKVWWPVPWLFLRVNLYAYTVYVRYFLARLKSSILRHSFIVIVSILIGGIAYSKLSAALISVISVSIPQLSWAVAVLTLCVYLLKKYYIDAKVKKLQVRLEAHWFFRVAFHLHLVRTLALISRTQART
jgi:hypothetical protein